MKRFLTIFRKRRLDRELDDELRFHIDAQIEQNLRRGMSAEQARRKPSVVVVEWSRRRRRTAIGAASR